jgi:geranylgeranyl diphosphate synthase type I
MKKKHSYNVANIMHASSKGVDSEIARIFRSVARGPEQNAYHVLRYFMGYTDRNFKSYRSQGGKRFRPGLAMFLAREYGAQQKVFDAAVAIELFHNATLIHDDIIDRDELRRGKPTVWKLWGVDKALNSGDIQYLLVAQSVARAATASKNGPGVARALLDAFMQVHEGQHLDFELTSLPIGSKSVSESVYMRTIQKKTGALVSVAALIAGIAAGKNAKEKKLLAEFGMSLGMAYQIADDCRSVWSTHRETGKDLYSDIREHKRTLPFLYALAHLTDLPKRRLQKLYSLDRQLTSSEIKEAQSLIDETDAYEHMLSRIRTYAARAKKAASQLAISPKARLILKAIVDDYTPEVLDVAEDAR